MNHTVLFQVDFSFTYYTFNKKKVSLMDTSCVCMFFFRIYLFQLNMKCSTQIENLIHYFIKIVGGQQIIKDLHMSQSGD